MPVLSSLRELTPDQLKLLSGMWATISRKRRRNELRSAYFDGKKRLDRMGISIPPPMADFAAVVGWPQKTCAVLARRLRPEGFTLASGSSLGDDLELVFSSNEMAAAERQAILSAVKHSVSFVFVTRGDVSKGEPDPLITVRSALDATAVVDPRSRRTVAALEIISSVRVNLYLPGVTLQCVRRPGAWLVEAEYPTTPGWVLCTPYVHGATVERPFGASRITRPVMAYTDMAVRTMLRQEVSAEFYSAPQRYMLGADQDMFTDKDGNPIPAWESIVGSLLAVPDKDEDDEDEPSLRRVQVGQFPQMSMQPHTDQLRSIAMMFSGESSIPVNYLGIIQDNPSSADAIRASEADLVSVAEDEIVGLSTAREGLARNVLVALHGEMTEGMAQDLRGLKSRWRDPSTPTKQSQTQAVVSQIQTGVLLPTSEVALEQLGYSPTDIARVKAEHRGSAVSSLVASIGARLDAAAGDPVVQETAALRGGAEEAAPAPAPAAAVAEPSTGEDAKVLKDKFEALGIAVRAGVEPSAAAERLGLAGIELTGAMPVSLRMREDDAELLEEK